MFHSVAREPADPVGSLLNPDHEERSLAQYAAGHCRYPQFVSLPDVEDHPVCTSVPHGCPDEHLDQQDRRERTRHPLQNVNILNHYVGMKYIEPDAIPELTYFPYVIIAMACLGLVALIINRPGPISPGCS